MQPGKKKAFAALLITITIWSSTFVVTKDALVAFPPITIALLRFATALVVLLPLYLARRRKGPLLPLKVAAAMGLCGVCLFFALQNYALVYCRAGTASLILAAVPAFTALASRWFLGEEVTGHRVLGIILTIAGVAAIVWADNGPSLAGALSVGGLLLVAAAVAWALYTVLGKKHAQVDPVVVTFQGTVWGVVFLIPVALLETQPAYLSLGWDAWASVIYLGAVASALPIFLWNYALRAYDASEASLYLNLIPPMAIVMAMVFLGESIQVVEIVAGLAVMSGVVLADRPTRAPGKWEAGSERSEARIGMKG